GRSRHSAFLRQMVVAGFAQAHVRGNKVRDNRRTFPDLKAKHALFSGTIFLGDVLVATELFGPGLDDDGFNIATRLCHVMEERPLQGTVTTPSAFELAHRLQETFHVRWLDGVLDCYQNRSISKAGLPRQHRIWPMHGWTQVLRRQR